MADGESRRRRQWQRRRHQLRWWWARAVGKVELWQPVISAGSERSSYLGWRHCDDSISGRGATSSSRSKPFSRPPSCHCLALTTPLPPSRHHALALPFPTSCCLVVELPYRPRCGAASILRPRSSLVVIALNEEDPWATLRNVVSSYRLSSLANRPRPISSGRGQRLAWWSTAGWLPGKERELERGIESWGPRLASDIGWPNYVRDWRDLASGLERLLEHFFFMELPSFSLEMHWVCWRCSKLLLASCWLQRLRPN